MARDGTLEIVGEISGELQTVQEIGGELSPVRNVSGELSVPKERVVAEDYERLRNKPSIEGNVLIGDKTFQQLGLNEITPQEIDEIIYGG